MNRLYLDFETYSECELGDCGAYVYARHPSTDLLCLGYKFNDEPTQMVRFQQGENLPDRIVDHIKSGGICIAHNAFFDRSIWHFVGIEKYNFPYMPIRSWRCSMLKAASHGYPLKLEKAAEAMNLPIGKDTISGRVLNKLSKPNASGRVYRYTEASDSYQTLYKYCARDVDVMHLIDKKIPDVMESEQELWFFDQKINARGIPVDLESLKVIIPKLEEEKATFNDRISKLTNNKITKITQTKRIVDLANSLGFPLPNLQKETVEEVLQFPDNIPPLLLEILEMRQMGGKSSTNKFKAMHDGAYGGRVRGTLVMYGAQRTGRWAGRQIQPHNFAKPTVKYESIDKLVNDLVTMTREQVSEKYKSFMHAASTATRGLICAPEGRVLNIADYNAIEPRILFWLSGDEHAVSVYASGGDIYIDMAEDVYNRKGLTKKDEAERWLGKQIILGCGYGMGPKKFQATCANYGVEIPFELAEKSVLTYRYKYKSVVNLWNGVEAAAKAALRNPGKVYECANGKIKFKQDGEHLYMRLPSGRKIVYPNAELREITTPWGQKKMGVTYRTVENNHWHRTSTFGGKFVENACQGIARDFMAYGMSNVEEEGYEVITTIHDEVVSESDDDFGDIHRYCELLVKLPIWGEGCPLAAEGKRLRRYQKI